MIVITSNKITEERIQEIIQTIEKQGVPDQFANLLVDLEKLAPHFGKRFDTKKEPIAAGSWIK